MSGIVLIGYMGCGKSTVAKLLARRCGKKLLDADSEIEKEQGRTISDIFSSLGEEAFRNMETEYLRKIAALEEDVILSTGGGMPLRKENAELMKNIGKVIYLKTGEDVIFDRVQKDTSRPLLQDADRKKKIHDMLCVRGPIYEAAAEVIIRTDDKTPEEIADYICRIGGEKWN